MTSLSALKQCPANWRRRRIRVSEIGIGFRRFSSLLRAQINEYSAPGEEGSYVSSSFLWVACVRVQVSAP